MTKRDWTESEAEVLAEFAGLKNIEVIEEIEKILVDHPNRDNHRVTYMPWSHSAYWWQTGLLLKAIWEKGLWKQFVREMEERTPTETDGIEHNDEFQKFLKYSAPPEAICRAILELEGE